MPQEHETDGAQHLHAGRFKAKIKANIRPPVEIVEREGLIELDVDSKQHFCRMHAFRVAVRHGEGTTAFEGQDWARQDIGGRRHDAQDAGLVAHQRIE